MKVELIEPYGYCVGVNLVIDRLKSLVEKHSNEMIFCIGQIVHNAKVNEHIEKLGIKIMNIDKEKAIDSIEKGVVVFSAHGTDKRIIKKAKEKGLIVYDLVCPFVKKTFDIIEKMLKDNFDVIYVGVNKHEESIAALSISNKIHFVTSLDDVDKLNLKNKNICVINQTTLSIIDIKGIYEKIFYKYPNAKIIDEICNSTRTRQQVILDKKIDSDGIIVVGDVNSNNSKSLYNIALKQGYDAIFVKDFFEIKKSWLNDKKSIVILSGASTPRDVVEEIYQSLKKY